MRTPIFAAIAYVVLAGIALAQVEASSSTYFLDVDPARYAGPASQRLAMRVNDEPRHVRLSPQDEICVQLQRSPTDGKIINARVRVLRPEPHEAVVVRVVAPDISPGTFRSTPWGMLLRVVNDAAITSGRVTALAIADAPVCAF
jgi:hypothetical protein